MQAPLSQGASLWPQLLTALPPRGVHALYAGAEATLPLWQDTAASGLPSADSGQLFEVSRPILFAGREGGSRSLGNSLLQ